LHNLSTGKGHSIRCNLVTLFSRRFFESPKNFRLQLHSQLQLLPDAPAFLQLENSVSENVVKTRIEHLVHFSPFSLVRSSFTYFSRIFRSWILFLIFTNRVLCSRSLSRVKDRIFASKFEICGILKL